MELPEIKLHPQREKRVLAGHPWIFSNEVAHTKGLESGAMVNFRASDGRFVGRGSYNPHSLISGRVYSRSVFHEINSDWIKERIASALALREKLVPEPYYRLIHAEADGLPGLIIDRFGDRFSVQLNSAGAEKLWPETKNALMQALNPSLIVLHNESYQRTLEGLERSCSVDYSKDGVQDGLLEVRENGLAYFADIIGGQKTGWYFDQRDNHAIVAGFCGGEDVLDLYCYSGGFGILAAAKGAASVTGVDSSRPALELAAKGAEHAGLSSKCEWVQSEVFEDLEKRISGGKKYGVVIADPPPFVKSKKDLAAGARGYRKLAKLSAKLVREGGFLFLASCSHNMDLDNFSSEVARGLGEARREGRVLHTLFASPDHPVHPHLPESAYLKALFVQLY